MKVRISLGGDSVGLLEIAYEGGKPKTLDLTQTARLAHLTTHRWIYSNTRKGLRGDA